MHTSLHFFVSILCILREIADIKCQEWSNNPDIDRHLQLARELLSQGMYNDALSHYHAAVDADPLNYLTFYTRASVYLAIGKIASALKDLTKVIELKPDFTAARLQRGKVFLKQGRLDEAHIDYENVLRVDPMNPEAHEGYNVIEPIKRDVNLAFALVQDRNFQDAIHLLDRLLQEVPWDSSIRELRAECYESAGDLKSAIQDLKSVIKSQSESLARHLKLSQLYYQIGDAEESLNSVRECLRFDPDHKDCFSHYKYVKKVSAHLKSMESASRSGDSTECVGRANKVLALEQRVHAVMSHVKATRCKCFRKGGRYKEAVSACTDALDMMPDNPDLLCERAEAHLENGNYDDAISDFQRASQSGDRAQRNRANEGKQRAAKIRKQLNKKNYYDILGVKKNAGKREIIKAYRQLAQKWHPDNFQDSPQKEAAEKKFIDIAAAKEVLTDPEKRAKFDQGEDPLDPENQQGNPFDPFQQGRPFSFKFHFS